MDYRHSISVISLFCVLGDIWRGSYDTDEDRVWSYGSEE